MGGNGRPGEKVRVSDRCRMRPCFEAEPRSSQYSRELWGCFVFVVFDVPDKGVEHNKVF